MGYKERRKAGKEPRRGRRRREIRVRPFLLFLADLAVRGMGSKEWEREQPRAKGTFPAHSAPLLIPLPPFPCPSSVPTTERKLAREWGQGNEEGTIRKGGRQEAVNQRSILGQAPDRRPAWPPFLHSWIPYSLVPIPLSLSRPPTAARSPLLRVICCFRTLNNGAGRRRRGAAPARWRQRKDRFAKSLGFDRAAC